MKLSLTLLIIFLSVLLNAQELDRLVSFGPATTSYSGDLNNSYSKLSGGFNIQIVTNRDKLIQTSLELNIGNIVGQNSSFQSNKNPQREPNTFFETGFGSFSFNLRAYLYRKYNFKFYLSQGIGGMRFVPKNDLEEKLIDKPITRNSDKETYSNLVIIFPRALGISYLFKNDYGISLDISQLTPMTDYIDNISQLGNPNDYDQILMYRLGVMIPIIYKKEKTKVEETTD